MMFIDHGVVQGMWGLMLAGGVFGVVCKLPKPIWDLLKRKFLVSLDVMDTDPAFDWLTLWLHEHPYTGKSRVVTVSTSSSLPTESGLAEPRFSPGPGHHLLFHRNRPVWFCRWRQEQTSMMGNRRIECYNFRILGRDQGIVRSIVAEARGSAERAMKSRLSAYVTCYGSWRKVGDYHPRPFWSVVLDRGVKEEILADAEKFLSRKEWYRHHGIPWHRGYLFSGPPGCGKSSLVGALAGKLGLNLYVLNVSGTGMTDERLADLVTEVPARSLLLLEDVDATTASRRVSNQHGGVTLSGLLNALDGVLSREGYIVVMTSNYPDRLDSALTRPGRVDLQVDLGHATKHQVAEMCAKFGVDEEDLKLEDPTTTAAVQQQIMSRTNDISMDATPCCDAEVLAR